MRRNRTGTAVIVVLVVVVLLTYASYRFVNRTQVEHVAAGTRAEMAQLLTCIDSGEELLLTFLAAAPTERERNGRTDNNPNLFRARVVYETDDSDYRARFTVLSPRIEEDRVAGLQFGLTNESSKLSLHAILDWERRQPGLARTALLQLPGMEPRIADAMLDWIDPDSQTREDGAEADDYAASVTGGTVATPTNAIPRALEELLPVRGATRSALLGRDQNANFHVSERERTAAHFEPGGEDRQSMAPIDSLPWSYYLTPYSAERNRGHDGRPRVYLNDPDLRRLRTELVKRFPDRWVHFIILYRQFGPAPDGNEPRIFVPTVIDDRLPPQFRIESIYDLIGSRVRVPGKAGGPNGVLMSPFSSERTELGRYLLEFADQVTVAKAPLLTGRININNALLPVLLAVPGIDQELADAIAQRRGSQAQPTSHSTIHEAWLLVEGLVSLKKMREIAPYVTTRGAVFRGQIVGFFDRGNLVARSELVIDATSFPPRTVCRRDLRRLGRGFSLDVLLGDRLSSIEEEAPEMTNDE